MKILIVSATFEEIKAFANVLKISVSPNIDFYTALYAGHKVSLLITGVGMVATAFHLGVINKDDFDIIINAGIAGSFTGELETGQLVNVTYDCFAELGADYGDKFIPLYDLDFAKDYAEPFQGDKGVIINHTITCNPLINELKKVKGITVNTINGEAGRIRNTLKLFSPQVESMEGAAFLYACLKKKAPCFQLRTISNYIEPRNLNNWKIPLAIGILNKRLIEIIEAFQ
jgi:futalosine hydrolase